MNFNWSDDDESEENEIIQYVKLILIFGYANIVKGGKIVYNYIFVNQDEIAEDIEGDFAPASKLPNLVGFTSWHQDIDVLFNPNQILQIPEYEIGTVDSRYPVMPYNTLHKAIPKSYLLTQEAVRNATIDQDLANHEDVNLQSLKNQFYGRPLHAGEFRNNEQCMIVFKIKKATLKEVSANGRKFQILEMDIYNCREEYMTMNVFFKHNHPVHKEIMENPNRDGIYLCTDAKFEMTRYGNKFRGKTLISQSGFLNYLPQEKIDELNLVTLEENARCEVYNILEENRFRNIEEKIRRDYGNFDSIRFKLQNHVRGRIVSADVDNLWRVTQRKSKTGAEIVWKPFLVMDVTDEDGDTRRIMMNQRNFATSTGFPSEPIPLEKRKKLKKKLISFFQDLQRDRVEMELVPYKKDKYINYSCISFKTK